ncbi:MAG: hypothetical protein Roseis2KO_02430 [Roseivirga sp.]
MGNLVIFSGIVEILLVLSTLLAIFMVTAHFSRNPHWSVRMFDFPVKQLVSSQLILTTTLALLVITTAYQLPLWWLMLANIPTIILLYSIYPYTIFHRKDLKTASGSGESIRLLSANVFMYNNDYQRLIDQIDKNQPDCILLLETDLNWLKGLEEIEAAYPYTLKYPLANTYGLLFYSKYKLLEPQIRFILKSDIPSIKTRLELAPGLTTWFYGVHPEPPSPTESESSEPRDIELLMLAREIRKLNGPVIFAGDFNDVAWSHTTRLFRRYSGLLDPRVGRGSFSTFHVKYPLFRWPLDHCFLSSHFRINEMQVLPSIGSDHFPMLIDMNLDPDHNHHTPMAQPEDVAEVVDKLEHAEEYD